MVAEELRERIGVRSANNPTGDLSIYSAARSDGSRRANPHRTKGFLVPDQVAAERFEAASKRCAKTV